MSPDNKNSGEDTTVMTVPETAPEAGSGSGNNEAEDNANPLEIPVIKTGIIQSKEQKIFVSKGQVISHYEDDMDVPTFLRKQMQ